MVKKLTIIICLVFSAFYLQAKEFYTYPVVTTPQDRDIYLVRRPATVGFDNATGTRNITQANLMAEFRAFTSARRAVLRQSATFGNVSIINTAGGTNMALTVNGSSRFNGTIFLSGAPNLLGFYIAQGTKVQVTDIGSNGSNFRSVNSVFHDATTARIHKDTTGNPHGTTPANLGFINTCSNRISYDGLDGSVIYTSAGVPDDAVGKKTDVSLNTLNGDFYRKDTAAVWVLKGNIKGATGTSGTNGTNGTDGAAATIAVGTVTALAYGSSPYVNNIGSSLAAIFDFGLVTGAPGSAGSPDTQAQILTKIATPTDAAKLTMQQGATEAGTVAKVEVRDSGGNLTRYVTGDGSEIVKKAGNTVYKYDTVTQSLNMYRGNGTTPAFTVFSSGRIKMYGSLTL